MPHEPRPDGDPQRALLSSESAPFYTIGQVSKLLDVRQSALRRLDELRIVAPERSDGGQRRYSLHEVDRLRHVFELKDEGLTIPAIRRILALEDRVARLESELAARRAEV